MQLKEKAFSAIRWTTAASGIKTAIQLTQVAFLARLLSPSDYGLMAIVSVLLSFASLFSDFGVNSAFVQRRDVTETQRTSLFWFNIIVSIVLTMAVMLVSPLLALLFGDGRLTTLICLSSLVFVINAAAVQYRLNAEKNLWFRPVVLIEVMGAMAGLAAAVFLANNNFGVHSLVYASILSSLSISAMSFTFLGNNWTPRLHFRLTDVYSFLGFGSALVANNLANQLNRTIDVLLCGRMLNSEQLGLYSVPRNLALQIQGLVNPIATRVAFPLISEVQTDLLRVKRVYLQTMNMTSSLNAPIYMFLAIFSVPVVLLLLGSGWERSASILSILSLWGFVRSTGNPVGSLLLGVGRADLSLKWNLALLLAVPPTVLVGSFYGPEGVGFALLVVQIALVIPGWYFLVRPICGAGFLEYSAAAFLPALLAGLAYGSGFIVSLMVANSLLKLLSGASAGTALYALLSLMFNARMTNSLFELAPVRR